MMTIATWSIRYAQCVHYTPVICGPYLTPITRAHAHKQGRGAGPVGEADGPEVPRLNQQHMLQVGLQGFCYSTTAQDGLAATHRKPL